MTPHELDSRALLNKSRKYVGLAFEAVKSDPSLFLAYAGAAIEFLGKAFLSSKSPFLVVDPANANSMFACAGLKFVGDVKTITAKTLNERLKTAIKSYGDKEYKFMKDLLELRNAELHGGTSPVLPYEAQVYQARLWTIAATILSELDLGLEDWVPKAVSAEVLAMVESRSEQLRTRIGSRKSTALRRFDEVSKYNPKVLDKVGKVVDNRELSSAPRPGVELEINFECPVCHCSGELAGYLYDENSEFVHSGETFDSLFLLVTGTCEAESFSCPICQFNATGQEELTIARLPSEFEVHYEKEYDFEPDYGND